MLYFKMQLKAQRNIYVTYFKNGYFIYGKPFYLPHSPHSARYFKFKNILNLLSNLLISIKISQELQLLLSLKTHFTSKHSSCLIII